MAGKEVGAESCGAQEAIMISIETRIINYFSKVRGKDRKRGDQISCMFLLLFPRKY